MSFFCIETPTTALNGCPSGCYFAPNGGVHKAIPYPVNCDASHSSLGPAPQRISFRQSARDLSSKPYRLSSIGFVLTDINLFHCLPFRNRLGQTHRISV